jgi:bacillithiol system protein YtxJ
MPTTDSPAPAPRPLARPAQLDEVMAAPLALVYKHSNRCPISLAAMQEVDALLQDRPDAPVWIVDVNVQRALSREVAERTGVRHESPQAILLAHGEVLYDASHFEVKADDLARELDAAGQAAA